MDLILNNQLKLTKYSQHEKFTYHKTIRTLFSSTGICSKISSIFSLHSMEKVQQKVSDVSFTFYTTNKQKVGLLQYNTEQKNNFEKIIMIKHRHAPKTI